MWCLNFYLIVSMTACLVASVMTTNDNVIDMTASVGHDVSLKCGHSEDAKLRRKWMKQSTIIAIDEYVIVNDERIESIESARTLKIKNTKVDDKGKYTCTINSEPPYEITYNLNVIEFKCATPKAPLNGGYIDHNNDVSKNIFYLNDKIKYSCIDGYTITNDAPRTCTLNGWTGDVPLCEPAYSVKNREDIIRLQGKLADIEAKLTKLDGSNITDLVKEVKKGQEVSNILIKDNEDNKAILLKTIENQNTITNKLVAMDTKITNFEAECNRKIADAVKKFATVENDWSPIYNYVNNTFKCLHDQNYNGENCRTAWENFRSSEIGQLNNYNGISVSEFSWVIENIEEKIAQRRAKTLLYTRSKEFYTDIPGHRVILELNPDDQETGYLGAYVGLRQGQFDGVIAWPFTNKYNLTLVSTDVKDSVTYQINPTNSSCALTTFEQPESNSDNGCGFPNFIEADTLLANKTKYLKDGAITIKFTMYK